MLLLSLEICLCHIQPKKILGNENNFHIKSAVSIYKCELYCSLYDLQLKPQQRVDFQISLSKKVEKKLRQHMVFFADKFLIQHSTLFWFNI